MDAHVVDVVQHQLQNPLLNARMMSATLALTFRMGYFIDFKWAAFDLKLVPKIIEAMRLTRDEADIQEKGLAALGTLCANCRGNKNDLVDLDGAAQVIDAMDAHQDVRTVQEAALCCLQFFTDGTDSEFVVRSLCSNDATRTQGARAGGFRKRAREVGLLPRIQRARKLHNESVIIDETSRGLMQQYFEAIGEDDPRLQQEADQDLLRCTHVSRRPLPLIKPELRQPRQRPHITTRPIKSRAGTAPAPSGGQASARMELIGSGRRAGKIPGVPQAMQSPTHGRRSVPRAQTAAAAASGGLNDEGLFEDGV